MNCLGFICCSLEKLGLYTESNLCYCKFEGYTQSHTDVKMQQSHSVKPPVGNQKAQLVEI